MGKARCGVVPMINVYRDMYRITNRARLRFDSTCSRMHRKSGEHMDTGIVIAVVAVIIVIALVAPLIVWFNKRNNARYDQLWPSLAPLVNGASKGDTLAGMYNEMPVQARVKTISDSDNSTEHYYELALTQAVAGKDWALSYSGDKLLGMGKKAWHVKTRDEALKQRLIDAGALGLVEQWPGYPDVSYKAKSGTLHYTIQIKNMFALPAPQEFRAQLDLLTKLARINQQGNAVANGAMSVTQ